MDKINDSMIQEQAGKNNKGNSSSVWLEPHEKLIEKLESAYKEEQTPKDATSDVIYFGFRIADYNLLINDNTQCEMLEEHSIHRVPLSADWLIGVSNVRSNVVPIIDLELLLTGEKANTETTNCKTIVIGESENVFGLMLGNMPTQITFKKDSRLNDYSKLPEHLHSHVLFSYATDEDTWLCIDFISFFESLLQ